MVEKCTLGKMALIGIVLLAVGLGGVTSSLQLDAERTSGQVSSGSLDMTLTEVGPATAQSTTDEQMADRVHRTWVDYTHSNLSEPVTNTLHFNNSASAANTGRITLTVTYTENDSATGDAGDNSHVTAQTLELTTLEYDDTSLLGTKVTDRNGNGRIDLDDLSQTRLTIKTGSSLGNGSELTIGIAGATSRDRNVTVTDGVDFTITLTATTGHTWNDTTVSTGNTIQYTS